MTGRTAIALVGISLLAGPGQGPDDAQRLDGSGAFYYPTFAAQPDSVLAEIEGGSLDAETYLRYLAARYGTRELEDLAFDVLLVRACRDRGLARSAPTLARALATQRFFEAGRSAEDDPGGAVRRKFHNEALRQLRIDALVREQRVADPRALRELFDRRHGVGGHRVRVRHVLVSFDATRRRLVDAAGAGGGEQALDDAAIAAAARARIVELHRRLVAGARFAELLRESDDRTTRAMLRDPRRADGAGFVEGYNYRRYGGAFADTVRALEVGEVSAPVRTATGFHLIELVERRVTALEDVAEALRAELMAGPAKPAEVRALRRSLLEEYGFRVR